MSLSVMPPRRRIEIAALPPKKRRKVDSKIEEITFDLKEREEYLSGFHKRKVQRQKQAQAEAIERERQEKLAARKILRESRKADLQKHIEAVNAVLKGDEGVEGEDSGGDRKQEVEEGSEEEGSKEDSPEEESPRINHDEEYVDEDKFTTVTVEAVSVSRDGLRRVFDDTQEPPIKQGESAQNSTTGAAGRNANGKQKLTKERPQHAKAKSRKKHFKYESKTDRKITRLKERRKGKRQAKERKGKY